MESHNILLNETDRTVALVIAYAPLRLGADILAQFTPERQAKIFRHIVELRPDATPEWWEWKEYIPFETMKVGGICHAVKLLEMFDQTTWQPILDGIAQTDPELADKIRQNIFTFECIAQLTNAEIAFLLKSIKSSQLSVALVGASENLKNRFFSNMSKRAVVILKEEIEYSKRLGSADIEKVRSEILHALRVLMDAGYVTLVRSTKPAEQPD